MSTNLVDLEHWSLEDLWGLHERLSRVLSVRIKAEKHELEKRLAILNRGLKVEGQLDETRSRQQKQRRKYPRVVPKYQNPQTSETWSGRGKRPRWLVAAIKSGRKIEDFQIQGG